MKSGKPEPQKAPKSGDSSKKAKSSSLAVTAIRKLKNKLGELRKKKRDPIIYPLW
jgi:hypothetical protein